MSKSKTQQILNILVLTISVCLILWATPEMMQLLGWESDGSSADGEPASYIVQGRNLQDISTIVTLQGGEITHTLPRINAVEARLTTQQIRALLKSKSVTQIFENRSAYTVMVASSKDKRLSPSRPGNQH